MIDNFLNNITMYRLVLYYLILLVVAAFIYSIFGILPFSPFAILSSIIILVTVCFVSNTVFAKIFGIPTNIESFYITALILVLIITPSLTASGIGFLILAGILAMASKFILNIGGKHIFNPAAIAVTITGFVIGGYASWWVGTLWMLPFSLLGILIVRKIRRFDLVFYFFVASLVSILIISFSRGSNDFVGIVKRAIVDSPLLFFGFIMLTEPLTTPPTSFLQSLYGGIVGILFSPIHFGVFYTSPEIALVIGNIFSYLVSPKVKSTLKLKDKIRLTPDIYDFLFEADRKFVFEPGQYLEWTLGYKNADDRGNRRYFTISSSPTEKDIRIGMKLPEKDMSSFKKEMMSMKTGNKIIVGALAGDFTLPKNKTSKLVFIAGGIGITPFRSIIKNLLEKNETRDIVLIYCEKNIKEMVYKDVFDEAVQNLNIRVIYFETEKLGHIDMGFIEKEILDFKERVFYLSGPHGMVNSFEEALNQTKINKSQIKIDYFPGYV